jgi:hypothetical protein
MPQMLSTLALRSFDNLIIRTLFPKVTKTGMACRKNQQPLLLGKLYFMNVNESGRDMNHIEVKLYLYRSWAEELAILVRNANPGLLEGLKDRERQTSLNGALLEISEALSDVGI